MALNIPLGVVLFGFTVGLPLWVTLKHPEPDRPAAPHPSLLRVVETGVERRGAADATRSVALTSPESEMADAGAAAR